MRAASFLFVAISVMIPGSVRSLKLPSRSYPYNPPKWCNDVLKGAPSHGRLRLANLYTPLYQLPLHSPLFKLMRELDISFFIKRDDCSSGVELGGNKVRKLEFLLADALAKGYDSVITIGGEQSNHCRATAAAARMVGLEPHLILRSQRADEDLGTIGNLLMDRMVGSSIYTCTPGEYGRFGSNELIARVARHLESMGKKPYCIPVGGSNGLGTWGYINGVDELLQQWDELNADEGQGDDEQHSLDHVVFACGSGGTATGIALGLALAHADGSRGAAPKVHAVGVCDDPDYFYSFVSTIAGEMGIALPAPYGLTIEEYVRQKMIVHQGKGLGYARSTPEELAFVQSFARETGIVLDPVYSGKALYNLFSLVEKDPETFRGQTILFWHTGGALGLYDKTDDLADTSTSSPCERLDVYGKGQGLDISKDL